MLTSALGGISTAFFIHRTSVRILNADRGLFVNGHGVLLALEIEDLV
jgi:hypothetical protein